MFLLTDRLTSALRLKRMIQVVEPCTVAELKEEPGAASDHAIVICDVCLDTSAAISRTKAVITRHRVSRRVPLLQLSRGVGEAALMGAMDLDATAVMPHDASPSQILFVVRRLVEARRPAFRGPLPPVASVVAANVRDAGVAFEEVLDALRQGGPVSTASLERGCDAVVAAVGGARLGAWLDVVRAYDDITFQHSLLVAGLAVSFSTRLGLSLGRQRLIGKAALLHDIGKLRVSRDILNKPGRLTPAEMDVVRSHPLVGYEMLVRQGGFDLRTLDMVLHHHEYLDGSGYPDGLRGDEISALVRIMTICDIYAALVERRSYKEPMPSRAALAILRDMGPKLDQGLIDRFGATVEG